MATTMKAVFREVGQRRENTKKLAGMVQNMIDRAAFANGLYMVDEDYEIGVHKVTIISDEYGVMAVIDSAAGLFRDADGDTDIDAMTMLQSYGRFDIEGD